MQLFESNLLFFEVLNNISFSPSQVLINYLYRPIIGLISIEIYWFFKKQTRDYKILKKEKKDLYFVCKNLDISLEQFHIERKKLEAIGLMRSFFDKYTNTISFLLLEPLCYENFLANKRLYNLLHQKYNQDEIEIMGMELSNKLNFFEQNEITSNIIDIFSNDKFDQFSFNFSLLFEQISRSIKGIWKLTIEIKEIIENFHKNFKISYNNIFDSCINSLTNQKNNVYIIDENLLILNLDLIVSNQNKIDKKIIVNLTRDKNIFKHKVLEIKSHPVFLDYRNNSTLKYLISVKKNELDKKEIDFVNKMFKNFNLSEEVFNLIIDFSLYKTYGKINLKYIEKIIQTFSGLAIYKIEDGYNYFLNLFSNKKPIKKILHKEAEFFDDDFDFNLD